MNMDILLIENDGNQIMMMKIQVEKGSIDLQISE